MVTTYAMYVQSFIQINMDNDGLFCLVPGMSEDTFKVRVDESGLVPVATHCRCSHFAHKGTCQHADTVNAFYSKLYKSNVEKALIASMDESVALEEQYEEVALVEQIEDQAPLTVKIAQPAAPEIKIEIVALEHNKVPVLNGQAQTAQIPAWLAILPSRQKRAA